MSRPVVKLTPELVLRAYTMGVFPMAKNRTGPVEWFSADPRAIMPLETFHVPHSLGRVVRQGKYRVTMDRAFERVIHACAEPGEGREETWINDEIARVFTELHAMGFAHSVEAWRTPAVSSPTSTGTDDAGELVGGLYGLALGGAFFGESMFSLATDASKVCLVHLVEHLKRQGYTLLDVQFHNAHLARFGVVEMAHDSYLHLLHEALALSAAWD
ncbi:MAG: leucyl/phenylalanyl-tRNA--protein transferase [Planctomycetes bacterium]|nr:leucyl/phenylalanyl-tRNA--protein transferase [Planctomycetota bacterium]